MNFRERFLRGDCSMDTIADWVDLWHTGAGKGQSMQEFLGLSGEEYQIWLAGGDRALAKALTGLSDPRYVAVHMDWNELGDQLQALVQRRMCSSWTVTIERNDHYFWDMQIEITTDVSEELSAQICERLNLENIPPDYFVDGDTVGSDQLLHLLEQLTGREVLSSHADDDGVWIICKEYRTSNPDYAARLISECEKRLCGEIRSRHYPTIHPDTACHQLFGFKEALKQLGIIPEEQWIVHPDHFAGCSPLDHTGNGSADSAAVYKTLPAPDMVQRGMQCLTDNGIAPDEAETVLQALGYILFDADIIHVLG